MSVKVGDRVRIVIEDEVHWVVGGEVALTNFNQLYLVGERGTVSIEVIEPLFVLPTKRWAQVLDAGGVLWTRVYQDNIHLEEWNGFSGDVTSSEWLRGQSGLRVISEGVDDE